MDLSPLTFSLVLQGSRRGTGPTPWTLSWWSRRGTLDSLYLFRFGISSSQESGLVFYLDTFQARQEGLRAPPGMLLGGPGPPVKRPTFDQLDKRASWSADRSMVAPGPHPPSQFLASVSRPHPNVLNNHNLINHPNTLPHHPSTLPTKKPIPLPR